MTYKLYNNLTIRRALISVLRTANATVDGDVIDRGTNNAGVTFAILTGLVTDGTWTFSIRESDDNSTYTNASVTVSEMGTPPVIISTSDDLLTEFGYQGSKRYVQLRVVSTGSTTGALIGAVAILDGGRKPVVK